MTINFGRYKSRKFILSFIALWVSVPIGIHNNWTGEGWALVLAAILGAHAAGNVMDTKYQKPSAMIESDKRSEV